MISFFKDRTILVTGGAGSIGSEIVRQLLELAPRAIRVYSRDESKHAYMAEDLGHRPDVRYLVGDVRDKERLRLALRDVDTVFHAAGLKHVPACEYNPFEAVQTNVTGTQNLIHASLEAGVRTLVAVSTDKAVSPTNTMGATKLLAEKVVAASHLWAKGLTLCSVRFGNVLASRGSVVPLVARQVSRGGPVLLTDPAMTRFMMSLSDAVRLTLTASRRARGGETFILRMNSLRVADLVTALRDRFAGALGVAPDSVPIDVTGARAGEKTHEDLMTPDEARRAELEGDLMVVRSASHPESPTPIDPSLYRSDLAPHLDRRGIEALLDRSLGQLSI